MYTYVSSFVFLSLCLCFCCECLYQFWDILLLIVCRHTSLDRICFSLFLWISVVVIGYIITHCTCVCQSLDSCFFLCFSFNAYIVTGCSSIDTSLDPCLSLFLFCFSQCFYPCTTIMSLLGRVKVRLLIRVSLSVFVLSVRLCPGILSVISCIWRSAFSSLSEY